LVKSVWLYMKGMGTSMPGAAREVQYTTRRACCCAGGEREGRREGGKEGVGFSYGRGRLRLVGEIHLDGCIYDGKRKSAVVEAVAAVAATAAAAATVAAGEVRAVTTAVDAHSLVKRAYCCHSKGEKAVRAGGGEGLPQEGRRSRCPPWRGA